MALFWEVVEPSGHGVLLEDIESVIGVRVVGQLSFQPGVLGLPVTVCFYSDSHKPPESSSLP